MNWENYELIVKLDPDKNLTTEAIDIIARAEIDAIVIGGTQNIKLENSLELLRIIQNSGYCGPIFQEITETNVIIPEIEGYLLPVVLNTTDLRWIRDAHLEAISTYGDLIPWNKVIAVAYLVCNPDAAVAQKTKSREPSIEEAVSYLTLAEKIFNFPLFYIEYSGKYGDLNLVSELAYKKDDIQVIYGGGIKNAQQAIKIKKYVQTIVIGNLMYESPKDLLEIVQKIK